MRKRISVAVCALAAATAATAADINIPFEKYSLKNGMRVVLSKDSSLPVVGVYVIYDVGARSEEKGRTGFAHLFEHMMFQGSANAPKGVHFKAVESNGGTLNGSTHPDFTDYYETLPSNKLPVALWLEADRMRSLAITDENLTNQKQAVKEERRLSFDNRPYNTAIVDRFPELAFSNWQSSHSLIGSYADLEAASTADVAKFFKTYYAPNNAVLAIAGDIDIPQTKKWIEQYFGDIPAQPRPTYPDMTEKASTAPVTETYKDKMAQVPAAIIGYRGMPERRSPEFYALVMLDAIFTAGDSSRFQLNLVKGKKSVIQYQANPGWPFAGASDYKAPMLYAMMMLHNPMYTGAQIVEQVEAEIAKIQNEGVPKAELDRVKTYYRAQQIGGLQTAMRRATLLGQYELFDGNPGLVSTELNEYMAVTPERIQAVAKKYFSKNNQVVLNIVPDREAPKKK